MKKSSYRLESSIENKLNLLDELFEQWLQKQLRELDLSLN